MPQHLAKTFMFVGCYVTIIKTTKQQVNNSALQTMDTITETWIPYGNCTWHTSKCRVYFNSTKVTSSIWWGFMYPAFTSMPGGVTEGDSGLCCCVPWLLSAINSLCWLYKQVLYVSFCLQVARRWSRTDELPSCNPATSVMAAICITVSITQTQRTW